MTHALGDSSLSGPWTHLSTCPSLYLDGVFVGNLTRDMPVLYAKRGVRVIRVESPGHEAYERSITVLGDPNHQVLNVILEKE